MSGGGPRESNWSHSGSLVYPLFYIRYVGLLLSTPLLLETLLVIAR